MTNSNPTALFRSLIVYAICVPLAVIIGYAVVNLANSNFSDIQSLGTLGFLLIVLIFPLMMKWHYPLLIFSCSLPATLFFLPGHPNVFLAMVALSLTISVIERILNRNQPFLPTGGLQWPLLAMLCVVIMTAEMTGGFGLRSMGSDIYGGKKYVFLIVGILSFFAFTARPIPRKHLKWYLALYFLGGLFSVITDLYPFVPGPLKAIYLVFPPSYATMSQNGSWELGVTRLSGIAGAAGSVFFWILARYGLRDAFLTTKFWRPIILVMAMGLIFLGGFRASIVGIALILTLLFCLEKLHRTGMMLVVVFGGLMAGALLVPLASHLPYTFQRCLAFLPLNISTEARMDAEGSTQWRLDMWAALLPEVPKYLLLGKGYSFSQETFNESMGYDATFRQNIDASQNPLALSSDFHSGPLSVILPFGIWGALVWLWYLWAGFSVVWRNYHFGDPEVRRINTFLFASFIAKTITFFFIFGSMQDDVGGFATILGFSIAINHGVAQRRPVARSQTETVKPSLAFPSRPAWQR